MRTPLVATLAALVLPAVAAAQLSVTTVSPPLNAVAPVGSAIAITFDRPLDVTTVTTDSLRAFGQWSGPVRGSVAFSNGNQTATLTPDRAFSAGEFVWVNLSHDLRGADTSALRAAGYAWQFTTATAASPATFVEIDQFSNKTGSQTRIYGASAGDLNDDGWLDLATVNEVSADVRVFLSRADGTGLMGPMLPREPIGVEASPNCTGDFDNDGFLDLAVSATSSASAWILLGAGDGTFASVQEVDLGGDPHGITALDADGDGDIDLVDANSGSNDLALLLNDGTGTFGPPTFFEGGVDGEYGIAAADMDGDGITDLVVGGRNGAEVTTMLGNGDGTFTAAGPPQDSGGATWVLVLGDVDGDDDLDAVTANDGSGTIGILRNAGDGTFAAPSIISVGSHLPSVDLGDLDGDGDLDMVPSSFGGGFWRWYRNDGTGAFSLVEEFQAPDNPSCAVLYDADNDGDLDMALTDEIADVVILMENQSVTVAPCSASPLACRQSTVVKGARFTLRDKTPDTGDRLAFTWGKGAATPKADFGNPLTTDDYALCLYEDGALVQGWSAPAGSRWKSNAKGFAYRDTAASEGLSAMKLMEGVQGKARITVNGKGDLLAPPDLDDLTGVLDVQVQRGEGQPCWGATYTPPHKKNDGINLVALSDAPTTTTTTSSTTTTTLAPVWSAIHAEVIGPTCGGCHGGSGGLSGLGDCDDGHAALVDVPSAELPAMDRVEPGDPTTSWLMHKLDGTQNDFMSMCVSWFCGGQMPLGGELSEPVRDAIRTWITGGAVNDCP